MISIYAAANIIMGALWVVFMPSYIAFGACERKKDEVCEPTFWMAAGSLVHDLWYPGTVRIKGFGATGNNRYMPDSEQNVLRPACIPCPEKYANDWATPQYGGAKAGNPDPDAFKKPTTAADDPTRLHCVRVTDFAMRDNVKILGKAGTPMSAKEYVWHQLFGKEWQAVHDTLLATANQTGNVDLYALQHKWNGKDQIPYNKALFKDGTPFPWLRMELVQLWGYDPKQPDVKVIVRRDAPKDYGVDGYYVVNGVPFCPPKLWHFWKRPRNHTGNPSAGDWSVWYTANSEYKELDKVVSSQPVRVLDLPHMCDPSQQMVSYCDKKDWGWYKSPQSGGTKELEWWYPGLTYTSIFSWEDRHYRDYIARFFAGGNTLHAVWHSLAPK